MTTTVKTATILLDGALLCLAAFLVWQEGGRSSRSSGRVDIRSRSKHIVRDEMMNTPKYIATLCIGNSHNCRQNYHADNTNADESFLLG